MNERRLRRVGAGIAGLLGLGLLVPACSFMEPDLFCCTDPNDPRLEEPAAIAQYSVAMGAARDLSAVARRSFDEVVTACRNLAVDLDAPEEALARVREAGDEEAAAAWCSLAAAQINGQVRSRGRFVVTFTAPRCTTSAAAKANCQALCAPGGRCDLATNPPRCDGGKQRVSCRGSCSAQGGAEVACEGACEGTCQGSCSAPSGVACQGKCQGACAPSPGGGIQADGTCKGICKGTCSAVAPGTTCDGTCAGSCRGACKSQGSLAAQCDGTCQGSFDLLGCEGGKLTLGCAVDPKCDANCDASIAAKAECAPPEISIQAADAIPPKYIASLKRNLPALVLVARGRGDAFVKTMIATLGDIGGSVTTKESDSQVFGCLQHLGNQVVAATSNMTGAVHASSKLLDTFRP